MVIEDANNQRLKLHAGIAVCRQRKTFEHNEKNYKNDGSLLEISALFLGLGFDFADGRVQQ
jgi:hypothetical protein